ncbi:MAG: YciI family protein [Betaproteobacteria bacterium]|nr:MAG: YciI family protein [Betaproteobacteria bacterium]
MEYVLLIYGNESAMLNAPKDATAQTIAAYRAYTEALKKAGVHRASNRLRPTSDATTVRAPGGKQSVLNGPFAETKEQLAGFYLIDVPDLDAALTWAKRCPGAAHGSIEVRPVWTA